MQWGRALRAKLHGVNRQNRECIASRLANCRLAQATRLPARQACKSSRSCALDDSIDLPMDVRHFNIALTTPCHRFCPIQSPANLQHLLCAAHAWHAARGRSLALLAAGCSLGAHLYSAHRQWPPQIRWPSQPAASHSKRSTAPAAPLARLPPRARGLHAPTRARLPWRAAGCMAPLRHTSPSKTRCASTGELKASRAPAPGARAHLGGARSVRFAKQLGARGGHQASLNLPPRAAPAQGAIPSAQRRLHP